MKVRSVQVYCCLLLLSFLPVFIYGQINGYDNVKWNRERIARGVVWKSAHTVLEDTIPQNINILIVNNRKRNISLVYSPQKNVLTSILASRAEAIAAINAGFFSIKDGGSDQAAGLSLVKLTDLMISLKCTDAVNLDGGGSTTMWIRGKPYGGVVNMPSDNKKFDHSGERVVADILVVK